MVGLSKLKIILLNKIGNLFVKAISTVDFEDGDGFQYTDLDLLKDEVKKKVTHLREYGFYSKPMKNAECFVAFPNGSRDDGFILKACHGKYEPDLEVGDVALVHFKGHQILLSEDNGLNIEIVNSKPITIKAKNVNIELEAGGQFSVAGTHFTVDA